MYRLSLIAAASLLAAPVQAQSQCEAARERYNSALDDIAYKLKRYTSCLSGSGGSDDCSTEFRRLKYAQDEFESAVSDVSSYCRY